MSDEQVEGGSWVDGHAHFTSSDRSVVATYTYTQENKENGGPATPGPEEVKIEMGLRRCFLGFTVPV